MESPKRVDIESAVAPKFVDCRWDIKFHHAAGATGSKFFQMLAVNQEIWGKRCPQCKRVLLPPRGFCERCFVETTDWVQAQPEGTVEAFTIVYEPFDGMPTPPYVIAYVHLGNADTALVNYVKGLDLSNPSTALKKIHVGARVRVVFNSQREGKIGDFWYELT